MAENCIKIRPRAAPLGATFEFHHHTVTFNYPVIFPVRLKIEYSIVIGIVFTVVNIHARRDEILMKGIIDRVFLGRATKSKDPETDEKENNLVDKGLKSNADTSVFISMVGVDKYGIVDEHEHLFDIFTKLYDFYGSSVHVLSAQDLWSFYQSKKKGANREDVDIYTLVEFFIQHHANGNFVLDECPFLLTKGE